MSDYSPAMMIAIIVVTFIAGYSIVSYAVKKFRAAGRAGRVDQDQHGPQSPNNDISVPKPESDEGSQPRHRENE